MVVDWLIELIDNIVMDFDVCGVVGYGLYFDVFECVGVGEVDLIVVVMYFDEINMIVC